MDWILGEAIGYLQSLRTMREAREAADFWQGVAFVLTPLAALIVAVWSATRWSARRHYRAGIAEQGKAKQGFEDERTLRREAEREVESLAARIGKMGEAGPTGFMRRADIEERDNNRGRLATEARAFLDGQSEALRRAFGILAKAEIGEGLAEGAPDFETARLHATAALSLDPQDRMARMLADDLAYARDMDMKGLTVTLADDREARLDAHDRAAMTVETADRYFFATRKAGRYRLMLETAEYGEGLARRSFGKTARPTLKFRRHRAEATKQIGQPVRALDQLTALHGPFEAAFGPDDPETFYMRYLIASCLQDAGRASEALEKGKALLPDQMRVLDADHPATLSTRYLMASCLQDVGRASEALEQGEALLPDWMRVSGADHPATLATRYLMASCLQDVGRASEALEKGEALLPDQMRVLDADHPATLTTRSLIASCLRDAGRASEALEQGEALLPDEMRVSGADHPATLTTRSLIALCLLDLDRSSEARALHEGVVEGLRQAGITGDESRLMKRALEVEARLAEDAA